MTDCLSVNINDINNNAVVACLIFKLYHLVIVNDTKGCIYCRQALAIKKTLDQQANIFLTFCIYPLV